MPKKTTSKTTTETEQVAAPVIIESAAPAVEKKARKPKAVKAEAPATVVDSVAPSTEPVVAVSDAETPLSEQSVEFLAKLQQLGVLISSLKAEYRTLEKKWTREIKTAQKQSSKRKRKAGNRAPSGFVKPTKISDELASFLGKEKGTEMARTDVTREINTYIRAHKLQDKDNGRKINPDTKLATLLKLKKTDELTYFNLQKYMSPHFAKAIKVEATATA
jgi:upstream activation factor subunit UAF30